MLEGVFQDEHGDYPVGTYVRNPPTSRHIPRSDLGCVIFVKLWQFNLNDRVAITVDTNIAPRIPQPGSEEVAAQLLFEDARETVQLETWSAATQIRRPVDQGAEVLVLSRKC